VTALLALGLVLAFWFAVLGWLLWQAWKGLLRGSGRAWRDEKRRP
jgi:hypothetical protein